MSPLPRREDWLPELVAAITGIAHALGGREPTPELLAELAPRYASTIPEHQVQMLFFPQGYLYDPSDDPGEPEYGIIISGQRFKAGWVLPADRLSATLKG